VCFLGRFSWLRILQYCSSISSPCTEQMNRVRMQ
jgi:hypothetical protein